MNPLSKAITLSGLQPIAAACDVSYQAVRKWERVGRMPRTEWTGETDYSRAIEQLTRRKVTRRALLAPWTNEKSTLSKRSAKGQYEASACAPAQLCVQP